MKLSQGFGVLVITLFVLLDGPVFAFDVKVLGTEAMPLCGIVDGKPSGVAVDVLTASTKYGAPNFEFRLTLPWARALKMVHEASSTPVAIIPLSRSPKREKIFKWITPLVPNQQRFATYGRKEPLKTIDEAKTLSIGLLRGHSAIPLLKQIGFTKIDNANSTESNAMKLRYNRIDALLDSVWILAYSWKQIGENPKDLQLGPVFTETVIYLGSGLSFPDDVAKSIANAIEQMKENGELQKIFDKWR